MSVAFERGLGRVPFRTRDQILHLFGGLDLIEPGLVPLAQWRPGPSTGLVSSAEPP
jgi:hypothetical protein